MEEIQIRKIKKEDLPSVVDIHIRGWRNAYQNIIDQAYLDSLNPEEILKKREKDYQENGFIVAVKREEIVGFCRFRTEQPEHEITLDEDCELLAIYVKPEEKYRGIGTKMFQFVVEEMKKQKRKKMILWCLKENQKARKFYEKMGGTLGKEKMLKKGDKTYPEVSFLYSLEENR